MTAAPGEEDIARRLLDATARLGAGQGIENLALREITATVQRSTTAVFQHFGSKDGLLNACMDDAFARDRLFHDRLLEKVRTMPAEPRALSALAAFYIRTRARAEPAQLWLEGLYKVRQFPGLRPLLTRWHALRRAFWAELLDGAPPFLPDLLADYTAVEEAYAAALADDPAYDLLLRETTDRLFARPVADRQGAAGAWLQATLPALATTTEDQGDTARRLLDQAMRVIVRRGAADLNLRRVATDANTAPSQIVYHFGDFANLRRQAITAVLMQGLPAALNPLEPAGPQDATQDWSHALHAAVTPGGGGEAAGFYVNYARVLGQACLLAKRDATLRPLILQLRAIEGSGIFRLSEAAWPAALRLERDGAEAFAIWIKGRAILNEALVQDESTCGGARIRRAAELIARGSL